VKLMAELAGGILIGCILGAIFVRSIELIGRRFDAEVAEKVVQETRVNSLPAQCESHQSAAVVRGQ
jgi:NhaP-type Na+/H+ or K+/H+ antiporter